MKDICEENITWLKHVHLQTILYPRIFNADSQAPDFLRGFVVELHDAAEGCVVREADPTKSAQ